MFRTVRSEMFELTHNCVIGIPEQQRMSNFNFLCNCEACTPCFDDRFGNHSMVFVSRAILG